MKRRIFLITMCLAMMTGMTVFADENAKAKTTTKVLIVTGGHGFQEKEFYAMFDRMPGIAYDKAVLPKEMDLLAPGLEKKYDIVISYDMNTFPITDEQRENFDKLLKIGMPLIVFHHSVGGYENWPLYREIAGGQYLHKAQKIDGKEYASSNYKHDIELRITVVDKKHPITKGINDFKIIDEGYKDLYINPKSHILLSTEHPDATKEVAWTNIYGKSPVFTILLGHDKKAFANPNLSQLLKQGIDWAVSEMKTEK